MTYRLRSQTGDSIAVPQLIFTNLTRATGDHMRVALYILATHSTDPKDIARALRSEEGYAGVGGTIAFDEQGRLTGRSPRIMVSRDGMFDFVEE